MNSENSVKDFSKIDSETEKIAKEIVDSAYQVHVQLGPGLLENAYETCLIHELNQRNLEVQRQVEVPLEYKGVHLNAGFQLDLLVANKVIVEIKAVEGLLPVHRAQLITYLKLTGHQLGFLINFNEAVIKKGIERIVFSKTKKS
jgi:GxxExxY protein